jgi:hypothetical protein
MPPKKIVSYTKSVHLDFRFLYESDTDSTYKYLHDAKRITDKSYLKRVKDWFKRDLDDPELKSLGLPPNNKLLSWKIVMVESPKKFKLTYTTLLPLNADDRKHFHYWLTSLDDGCNNIVEFYKIPYCAVVRVLNSS